MKANVCFAAIVAAGFAMHNSAVEAASDRLIYSFCSQSFCSQTNCTDGAAPRAGLLDVNGMLYGTTEGGGTGNCGPSMGCGTVFSMDPGTGAETVLHSFTNGAGDGGSPVAGLIDVNGTLYGTTVAGGSAGRGTVFSIDPNTGAVAVLHSFAGSRDGRFPEAGLIAVKDMLYGTTEGGGTGNCNPSKGCGTVFAISLGTGHEKILHSFQSKGGDGTNPVGSLVDIGGTLYGTTTGGGTGSCPGGVCGTVFAIDRVSGAEKVLYSFGDQASDGDTPDAGLTKFRGTLYGTTYGGGGNGVGTIFAVNPATGEETVLYSFESKDGTPVAALTKAGDTLYGTTGRGVFKFSPGTGSYKLLHRFCRHYCGDGENPQASVIAVNGTLYGTTAAGGASGEDSCRVFGRGGCGTIFAVQMH